MTTVEGDLTTLPDLELYRSTLASIAKSADSVAGLLQPSLEDIPQYANGISLLSLKNSLMLSYLHKLTLVALCKVKGISINDQEDTGPHKVLIEDLVKTRIMLEKIKPLESKLKYQIDKLVKKAQDAARVESQGGNAKEADEAELGNDPLAFRPNPAALAAGASESEDEDEDEPSGKAEGSRDGIYRPPRLAPVAYNEPTKGKKGKQRPEGNALLRDMAASITSSTANPYMESTSGLGITPSLQSRKAKKLAEITRYEEDNMTRLFMTKKDAKRRRMDEEEVALGGAGSREDLMAGSKGVRGKRAPGFENEFDDLLGAIGKKRKTGARDGYDALRAMRRERKTTAGDGADELLNVNGVPNERPGKQKKGRFETAVKRHAQAGSRGKGRRK